MAALVWSPLAAGAWSGWALATTELLVVVGLTALLLAQIVVRRLAWRPTALDLPGALLVALVLLQLALGNGTLARWALRAAEALETGPPLPVLVGTVAPALTARSLVLLLTCLGTYVLVVNVVRSRRQLDGLVQMLVFLGGVLALAALLDHIAGGARVLRWRESPAGGRLAGTFANPGHFAAWLTMLVCLGLGYLTPMQPRHRITLGNLDDLFRRLLPFAAVVTMALAVVFTLSRGALVSLLLALAVLAALHAALGFARFHLLLTGALLVVVAGAGAAIGLEPFLARAREMDHGGRWLQLITTLPMVADFPLLGVGLGAYQNVYPMYQPATLAAGRVHYPYAHNDLLQVLVELGLGGAILAGLALWRVGRDLVGVHMFGRGRCPVGGGAGRDGQRHDPFSVGIGAGALGAVVALLLHSTVDFAARLTANGVLVAACLGIATVALHTRFGRGMAEPLEPIRGRPLGRRPAVLATRTAVIVAAVVAAVVIIRPALVETWLRTPEGAGIERALTIAPSDPRALDAGARQAFDVARQRWNAGRTGRAETISLLERAVAGWRDLLAVFPTDPHVHERLGWAHADLAILDGGATARHQAAAFAHGRRAITLAPSNPFLHRNLVALAVAGPEPVLEVALPAARAAIEGHPGLVGDVVDRLLPANLDDHAWASVVPPSTIPRLVLADTLEGRGRTREASGVYRLAIEKAGRGPGEASLARFMFARLLMEHGALEDALALMDDALRADPRNGELLFTRARLLDALGSDAALDAYRTVLAVPPPADGSPFALGDPRARALETARLGGDPADIRYLHGLAQHLARRGRFREALAEWNTVLTAAPLDERAHFARGVALEALGEQDEALTAYRRAVTIDGSSVPFRLHLARRLLARQEYLQAVAEYRVILRLSPGHPEAQRELARLSRYVE